MDHCNIFVDELDCKLVSVFLFKHGKKRESEKERERKRQRESQKQKERKTERERKRKAGKEIRKDDILKRKVLCIY